MSSTTIDYPIKIRNVITKLTKSTQLALKDQLSRIEIELPPGVTYGIEKSVDFKKLSDKDKVILSNREAGRLITDMFAILSSTTTVLFSNEKEAFNTRNLWSNTFRGQVLSMESPDAKGFGKLRSRRFSKEEQEQALFGNDGIYIPDNTEVLLIVNPNIKDLKKIQIINSKLGNDTLIILLNARLDVAKSLKSNNIDEEVINWCQDTFVNVYNYAPPVLSNNLKKELLLYHEYKSNWYIAEQINDSNNILGIKVSESSKFNTLWESPNRPTNDDIIKLFP